MVIFSSTPEMTSSTTTSQPLRRRRPCLFIMFHEEVTGAPTAKPNRLQDSPTRIRKHAHGWDLTNMHDHDLKTYFTMMTATCEIMFKLFGPSSILFYQM
jgi:hypothetical protein